MYTRIKEGQHEFSFEHDVFLDENQKSNFIYNDSTLSNLDAEINIEGVIQFDQNGEYEDISCSGTAIFYTQEGNEVVRIYIDLLSFHGFNNQFKKAYNINILEKIINECSFGSRLDFPTSIQDRI